MNAQELKLRTLSSRAEITKLLKRFTEESLEVKVFEPLSDETCETAPFKIGQIFKVSSKDGTFSIRPVDDNFTNFEKKRNIFLKVEQEGIEFTCFAENFGEKFGSFNIPSEVFIRENRRHSRTILTSKLYMKIRSNGFEQDLRIIDISQGGACLYVQEELDTFIKHFETFEVLSISGVEHFPMTFAKVIHSRTQKGTSVMNCLKVGISFEDIIEEELIKEII